MLLPPGIKAPFHVTDKAAARASDEKNKLNKTKNTLGLRTPFIISSLFFLKKKKFNIFVDLSFFKILSMKMY